MLAKANLKCPNCLETIEASVEECPGCELHLERLDALAGTLPRHDSSVTDYQEAMSLRTSQRLGSYLLTLGRQFPQVTFSAFFFPPPRGIPHKLYAFWLANRGRFTPLTARAATSLSALLLVDCDRGVAVLNVGYGLEAHLPEELLDACLAAAAPSFDRGDYAGGVRRCFSRLAAILRQRAKEDPVDPDRADPGEQPPIDDAF